MTRDIDSIPSSGKEHHWEDDLPALELPAGKWVETRVVGVVRPFAKHWVETKSGKIFPIDCPRFNPDTLMCDLKDEKGKLVHCWACVAGIKISKKCYLNVIDYRYVGKVDNPVRTLAVPMGIIDEIRSFKELNKVDGTPMSLMDKKYGCRISFKHEPKADPNARWSCQKGERSKLSSDEKGYEVYDFDSIIAFPDQNKVKSDLIRLNYLDEDGNPLKDASSKDKKKSRSSSSSSEDEDTSTSEEKVMAKKSKKEVEAVSSEESSSEESSSEDEAPKGKKVAAPAKAVGKKAAKKEESSEEDSEETSSSEESSEDEKPAKKGAKKAAKKDSSEEESSEEDSGDASSSEEDEKPAKKGAKKASKKEESSEDSSEEDSEEDSSSEEESSEDEKPAKKAAKKSKK